MAAGRNLFGPSKPFFDYVLDDPGSRIRRRFTIERKEPGFCGYDYFVA
jgi:hypothetical protein